MCENSSRHVQLHRFDACLPTPTLFSVCITDILVLQLPTELAAPTATTTRHCCLLSPKKFGLLMTEEGGDRFWAFLEQVTALLLTHLWEAVLLLHYWQHRTFSLAANHNICAAAPGGVFPDTAQLPPFLLQLMLLFF